jgi:hypothetical protein
MLFLPVQIELFDQLDGYRYPHPLDNQVELPNQLVENLILEQQCRYRIDMRDLLMRIFGLLLRGEIVFVCRGDEEVGLQDVNAGRFRM